MIVLDAKRIQDAGRTCSGMVGYCHYIKTNRGIEVEWDGSTVISVKCEHEICGYADVCEAYKQHPVGFVQVFPNAPSQEKMES